MPILTFRPTSEGALHQIFAQYPETPSTHWDKVDEVTSDGDSTYIQEAAATGAFDTFLYSAPSIHGKINSITVYVRAKQVNGSGWASPVIYLSGDYNYSSLYSLTASYAVYSDAMSRPGGGTWTVADLANIEFGVYMKSFLPGDGERCTQVWMEIDYTEGYSQILD